MDVQLVEVGPRDGLQNESAILDTKTKVALVRRLMDAGVTRIEVASFVHPGLVPQMADAENVCAALPETEAVSYIGVVLNGRGLDRALSTSVNEINFVVAASEQFSQRNQGAALEDAVLEVERMIPVAHAANRFVTVTISVAFGCPFEGEVDSATVIRIAQMAAASGAHEVAIGDTIGVAVPSDVSRIVPQLQDAIGDSVLRVHFHDTRRTGLGNVAEALRLGVRVIDASVGGVGGCPFAPQATGNVATEDVLYLFERAEYEHGIDAGAIVETGRWLGDQLGIRLPSAIARSGGFPSGHASGGQE